MCNVKFRRQHPIGPYSIERNLIVEVDGGQHAEQSPMTRLGVSFLRSHGYRVLRFWNQRVLANTNEVLDEIEKVLNSEFTKS